MFVSATEVFAASPKGLSARPGSVTNFTRTTPAGTRELLPNTLGLQTVRVHSHQHANSLFAIGKYCPINTFNGISRIRVNLLLRHGVIDKVELESFLGLLCREIYQLRNASAASFIF